MCADKSKKYSENVLGRYYVDRECVDCDACRTQAPEHFGRNDSGGYSFVFKQPETPEELEKCVLALEACPVEAIGEDGES
ncbi:MAG: ferredoxin [Halobacteriovoraceae bacterium]|jgi:ferredoxin|nr:ferredoxin [Halobacteriovoraceae bacterium]MBT5093429.1 ferredoxin [Halobacteriovoraceae bacterium]